MKLGNQIKKILKADRETLTVRVLFADGIRGDIDLGFIFATPRGMAAELLRGGAFEKCFVEHGALAWPNGYELCPDALRMRATVRRKGPISSRTARAKSPRADRHK